MYPAAHAEQVVPEQLVHPAVVHVGTTTAVQVLASLESVALLAHVWHVVALAQILQPEIPQVSQI
jgi:hypothetical protein